MAKNKKKTARKTPKKTSKKSDEMLECFYCGGLVHEWDWRCQHCGKLFNSGKRAIAIFVVVIILSAVIGTYPIWRPRPYEPPVALTIVRVTPVDGNTTAYIGAHPSVEFDQDHPFDVAKINKQACVDAFSLTPSINGTLYWSGFGDYENFMEYMPNRMGDNEWLKENWLQPNTTYYLKVTRDCRDLKGNRLAEEWNSWFHTEDEPREQPGGG